MGRQSRERKQKRIVTSAMRLSKSGCSLPEFTIYWWLVREFPDTEYRAKPFGFELDIYIPSIACAVEYDGRHWHVDKVEADNAKDMQCLEHDIRLIRIRDYELPDTKRADRISFNELTWLELGPVIEQLFLAFGKDGVEVDMGTNADVIYQAYEIMTGSELHFANRMFCDFAQAVCGESGHRLRSASARIVSDVRGHVIDDDHVIALAHGWKDSPTMFVFDDSWYDAFSESSESFDEFCSDQSYFGWSRMLPSGRFVVAVFDEHAMRNTGHAAYYGFQIDSCDEGAEMYVEVVRFRHNDDDELEQSFDGFTFMLLRSGAAVLTGAPHDWPMEQTRTMGSYVLQMMVVVASTYANYDSAYISSKAQSGQRALRKTRKRSSDTEIRFVRDMSMRKGPAPVRELSAVTYKRYGTHASPVAHIRRGHYHRFWCGSGENKHIERRWVEETRVNWHEGERLQTNVSIVA